MVVLVVVTTVSQHFIGISDARSVCVTDAIMKFSSVILALPLMAFAAVLTDSSSNTDNAGLAAPGPPQMRKDAIRKYFKVGRTFRREWGIT